MEAAVSPLGSSKPRLTRASFPTCGLCHWRGGAGQSCPSATIAPQGRLRSMKSRQFTEGSEVFLLFFVFFSLERKVWMFYEAVGQTVAGCYFTDDAFPVLLTIVTFSKLRSPLCRQGGQTWPLVSGRQLERQGWLYPQRGA